MSSVTDTGIVYPTRDGKPMGETQLHREVMVLLIQALEDYFANRSDVYVGGNMLVFHEEGNNRAHVSPDVFVVFGVSSRMRENYKIWEEPKQTLDFVIEVTSKSTRRDDMQKKDLYRSRLGVREYLLFDPYEEYLKPAEQLHRLIDDQYVDIAAREGRFLSEALGLEFEREGQFLRLIDPATGQKILTREERAEQAEQREIAAEAGRVLAEKERQKERELRLAAERRSAEAEAELARLRAELEARNHG